MNALLKWGALKREALNRETLNRETLKREALQRYGVKALLRLGTPHASTFQRFNASTPQRFNPSTFQRFNAPTLQRLNASTLQRFNASTLQRFNAPTFQRLNASTSRFAFTLIELILVLALLVIITSLTAPAMSRFIRGRALDTEARRIISFMHAAQSRAVSEGAPMMLWINEQTGAYGLAAETSGQNGDSKADQLTLDSTLAIAVVNNGTGVKTLFNSLPAIRFQADGTVDENSPQSLKLTDSDGFTRLLTETPLRTGYEVTTAQ